jgi:hypothetical protein
VEEQGKQRAARDDKSERRGMTTAMLGHSSCTVMLLLKDDNRIFVVLVYAVLCR